MIEALRSVRYEVSDLAIARQWYSQWLELEPYLSSDTALRYFVDGSWLEITVAEPSASGRAIAYWGVDNLGAELLRLHQAGMHADAPPTTLDAMTKVATFRDPFGNRVGLMEVNDPNVQRVRSHRTAEKLALRNVRAVLDDLSEEEHQQRRAHRVLWALVALAVLAGTLLLVSKLPPGSADNRIAIPVGGKK